MQKIRSSLERSVLLRQSPLTSKGNRSITVFAGNPNGGPTELETKYTLRTKYPMCHVPMCYVLCAYVLMFAVVLAVSFTRCVIQR